MDQIAGLCGEWNAECEGLDFEHRRSSLCVQEVGRRRTEGRKGESTLSLAGCRETRAKGQIVYGSTH